MPTYVRPATVVASTATEFITLNEESRITYQSRVFTLPEFLGLGVDPEEYRIYVVPDDQQIVSRYLPTGVSTFSALPAQSQANLRIFSTAARIFKERGGITVDSVGINTSLLSQQYLTGAFVASQHDAGYETHIKAADGTFVAVDAAQIEFIAESLATHVGACFDVEATVDAGITGATITTQAAITALYAAIDTEYTSPP